MRILRKRTQINRGKRVKDLFNATKEELSLLPSLIPPEVDLTKTVIEPLLEKKKEEDYSGLTSDLKEATERAASFILKQIRIIQEEYEKLTEHEEWKEMGLLKKSQLLESWGKNVDKLANLERLYSGKETSKIKHEFVIERSSEEIRKEIMELDSVLGNNITRSITLTEIVPIEYNKVDKGNGKDQSIKQLQR